MVLHMDWKSRLQQKYFSCLSVGLASVAGVIHDEKKREQKRRDKRRY